MDNFQDWKLKKIYDILIYGSIDRNIYPLRHKLYKILLKYNNKFRIKILEHPGYNSKHKGLVGRELSKLINQSWITVCTSSINQILLKKYLETGLSNSLILGNYPQLKIFNISENIINCDLNESEETILEKINLHLNNKNIIKNKTNKVYQYMKENYSYQKGLEIFEKYIDYIKNNI